MLKEINENIHWYRWVGHTCYGMRNVCFEEWLKHLKFKKTPDDEICVFALSFLFHWNSIIHNGIQHWFMLKVKPGVSFGEIFETSEMHFALSWQPCLWRIT